jgi:hypothetical protein
MSTPAATHAAGSYAAGSHSAMAGGAAEQPPQPCVPAAVAMFQW